VIEKLEYLIGLCVDKVGTRMWGRPVQSISWVESLIPPGEKLYYQSGIFGRYRRGLKRPGRVRPSSKSFPVLTEQMIVTSCSWAHQNYIKRPRLQAT
jgi:hypothetical protein